MAANIKLSLLENTRSPSTGDLLLIQSDGILKTTSLSGFFSLAPNIPSTGAVVIASSFTTSGDFATTGNLTISGNSTLGTGQSTNFRSIGSLIESGRVVVSGVETIKGELRASGLTVLGSGINSVTNVSGILSGQSGEFKMLLFLNSGALSTGIFLVRSGVFGSSTGTQYFLGSTTSQNITLTRNAQLDGLFNLSGTGFFLASMAVDAFYTNNTDLGTSASNTTTIKSLLIGKVTGYLQTGVFFNRMLDISGGLDLTGNLIMGLGVNGLTVFGGLMTTFSGGVGATLLDIVSVSGQLISSGKFLEKSNADLTSLTIQNQLNVSGNTNIFGSITNVIGSQNVSHNVYLSGDLFVSGSLIDVGSKYARFSGDERVSGVLSGISISSPSVTLSHSISNLDLTKTYNVGDIVFVTGISNSGDQMFGSVRVAAVAGNSFSYTAGATITGSGTSFYVATHFNPSVSRGVSGMFKTTSGRYRVFYNSPFQDNFYSVTITRTEDTGNRRVAPIFVTTYATGFCDLLVSGSGVFRQFGFKAERVL